MPRQDIKISKFLSLVLRHSPQTLGVSLDEEGWIDIDVLLEACRQSGKDISPQDLQRVVAANDKQRFVIRDGRIRANQGHSLKIDLALVPVRPLEVLYHGTASRFVEAIREQGLKKMNRQHVHLSPDLDTARKVGTRHGKPVILAVAAGAMFDSGHVFYCSENGVWLTDSVPWEHMQVVDDFVAPD